MMRTIIILSRRTSLLRTSRLRIGTRSISSLSDKHQTDHLLHVSPVYAEALHRYRQGGYYPVTLGQCLNHGRYKVLHKLGWGGYSTVWAARDQRKGVYVAIKICVAQEAQEDHGREPRELRILKKLSFYRPSLEHTVNMLDDFDLNSPNGLHKCLVYELLGLNISELTDAHFSGRLPGKLAKAIAKQVLLGLETLHQHNIGHGDLHTRNLAFTVPFAHDLTEDEFMNMLGKPDIGYVQRTDGKDLEPGMPKYIVSPVSYQTQSWNLAQSIKMIDFGESFIHTEVPQTLHTPLCVRAPEVIFQDPIDYRVDLWSMGCMLFELFTGQPPFDNLDLMTPKDIVDQMQEMASDALPDRWQEIWNGMNTEGGSPIETGPGLQEWLEEVYFDVPQRPDLTRDDVARLGEIIGKFLRFEPSARASAREVLNEPWFSE